MVAIGIDLGSTNSRVGVWQNDCVEIITNDHGNRATPSYIAFTDTECLVGDAAKNSNDAAAFYAKRLMGRKFEDSDVQADLKNGPFKVVSDESGNPVIQVASKTIAPKEIASMVLRKLRETADVFLGEGSEEVRDAVITVPNYYEETQEQAVKDAAVNAGLNVLGVIDDFTAATIAYGLDKKDVEKSKICIVVVDIGGKTLNLSLKHRIAGSSQTKTFHSVTSVGGADIDNSLVLYCINEFNRITGKDASGDVRALGLLCTACEHAKCALSSSLQTTVEVESLFEGVDFSTLITRELFETKCGWVLGTAIELIKDILSDSKVDKSEIDHVIVAGGLALIPKVQADISAFFDGKVLLNSISPDEVVVKGAAMHAAAVAVAAAAAAAVLTEEQA